MTIDGLCVLLCRFSKKKKMTFTAMFRLPIWTDYSFNSTTDSPWYWLGYWRPDREALWDPSRSPVSETCIVIRNGTMQSTECENSVASVNTVENFYVCEGFQTKEYLSMYIFKYLPYLTYNCMSKTDSRLFKTDQN